MNEALDDAGVDEDGALLAGLGVADAVDDIGLVLDVNDHDIGITAGKIVEHFGNGLSKSALRRLYKENGTSECMMCPETCDTKRELIRHLRNKKHFCPKDKLDEIKGKLAKKVSTRISESSGIATEYQFLDLSAIFESLLSKSEKVQYAKIFKMVLQLIRCR
mmetsp:Transcript_31451/g.67698  ORF Transcript_31451/g.67698 Transcript_31451/m.67698 type:complete len:162 (-) Transcript_31451:22-507(-)